MKVSGIVVVTGPQETEYLGRSAPALRPQVDELVIVANGPGSVEGDVPTDARIVRNDRMLGFSANINAGIAATSGVPSVQFPCPAAPNASAMDE